MANVIKNDKILVEKPIEIIGHPEMKKMVNSVYPQHATVKQRRMIQVIFESHTLKHTIIDCLLAHLFPDHKLLFIQRSFTTRPRMVLPWQLTRENGTKKKRNLKNNNREHKENKGNKKCVL